MTKFDLTELQYSNDREGPWRLYIFDHDGFHSGGQWFRKPPLKYPAEEITATEAMQLTMKAAAQGHEVHICDAGDRLVYRCKGLRVLYPKPSVDFWKEIGA